MTLSYIENPKDYTPTHTHTWLELINKVSKVAVYKVNKQKSLLCTCSEKLENEIKKIPFTIASKRIHLTKEGQDFHVGNYKASLKETK